MSNASDQNAVYLASTKQMSSANVSDLRHDSGSDSDSYILFLNLNFGQKQ